MAVNINNLNVITFIKDIYLSLKHIDQNLNIFKNDIDSRMTKLEDNYNSIQDKIISIEQLISKIDNKLNDNDKIDKNIEAELFNKMYKLDKNNLADTKLELKPKELTIANILENNYSLLDVNKALMDSQHDQSNSNSDYNTTDLYSISDNSFNLEEKKESLDNLLFS
jgi:hypothetical protein